MQPTDCPSEWEYEDHPHCNDILDRAALEIIVGLRRGQIDTLETSADTRPVHYKLFAALTPPGCEYFAGHYRGEDFKCLRYYEVGIQTDLRVGYPPESVLRIMVQIERRVRNSLKTLDEGCRVPNSQMSPEQKLLFVVALLARCLSYFCECIRTQTEMGTQRGFWFGRS